MAACTLVHKEQGLTPFPRLFITPTPEGSVPLQCRHCAEAPCVQVCPVDAIQVQGPVILLDEKRCVGCGICVLACPFGCIEIHTERQPAVSEGSRVTSTMARMLPGDQEGKRTRQVAIKCDLCHFRLEGPVCISVCPTKTLQLLDENDIRDLSLQKRQQSLAAETALGKLNG
jgi:Fe-S-cluster-containing hydrogenase component 2